MTNKKLFELLIILNGLKCTKWKTVMDVVDCIQNDKVEIIKKQWNDSFKQKNPEYYPLNLSDIHTWSTFDDYGCIDLQFENKNGKLWCDVKIYEATSFRGRSDVRFTAKLIFPNKFIKKLETNISWKFDNYSEDEYEKFLRTQKQNWINDFKTKILSK